MKDKQTGMSLKKKGIHETEILELIYSDLCGPIDVASRGGARYIMVLVHDFSRTIFVCFLKAKLFKSLSNSNIF